MFFCLFACLVICDCMLDTVVSFTLLSAGYFCIPISLVEFCFGIQLNYVELIFWVFFYALLGKVRAVFNLGLFILHYFQSAVPSVPQNTTVSHLPGGNRRVRSRV